MNEDSNIWTRQEGESSEAYEAFTAWLSSAPRSIPAVASTLGKSPSLLRRWSVKFDWRERSRKFDSNTLEEMRRELRRKLTNSFLERWQQLDELADMAADALRAKIQQASPRTLAEIVEMASEKQLSTVDKLKLLDITDGDDRHLTINIVRAGEPVNF